MLLEFNNLVNNFKYDWQSYENDGENNTIILNQVFQSFQVENRDISNL